MQSLSTLLHLTAGVQSWVIGPADQKVALKTSPSGGARQPIELYVVALNVQGLRKGLYHYAADRHALERLPGRVDARDVQRYFPQQWWYKGASAVIFFTAVFGRVQWRYAHARAYRTVLIEAGLSGLASVSTDVGATREVIDHGRTGLVVACDDAEALASAVAALMRDPARRLAMGNAALDRCSERFTIGRVAPMWVDLLSGLPAGPRSTR